MTVLTSEEVAQAFTTWFTETQWLPFTESERADITGPGHQDKESFAGAVNAFDRGVDIDLGSIEADQVEHKWAIVTRNAEDDVYIRLAEQGTDNAVPVTTIWGVR